jgi:hypothetical protein
MFKVNKTSSSKNTNTKPVAAVRQEEAEPTIKLKPIENSKLYRRRSLSRENIAKRNRLKSDNNTTSGPRHTNDAVRPQRHQQPYQTENLPIVDKTSQARYGNRNTSSTMAAHVSSDGSGSAKRMGQPNDVLDKFKVMELVWSPALLLINIKLFLG